MLFSLPHGGWVLSAVVAAALFLLWRDGTLWAQTVPLMYRILSVYDRAYGWGLMETSLWTDAMVDWPMGVLAVMVSVPVCRCLCRGSRVWPGTAACILPLLLCIVVTDTVPSERWLFVWLAALLLLILPASVRQENGLQGLRLTAGVVLPVLLFLLALFSAIPQKEYVNQAEALRTRLFQSVRSAPAYLENGVTQLTAALRAGEPKQVDLRRVGPQPAFSYPVMEVTAEKGGLLYLRGQDYDVYTGLGWSSGMDRRETFAPYAEKVETLTVQTRSALDRFYLPYYTEAELVGGLAENPGKIRAYSVNRTALPEDWRIRVYTPENAVELPSGFDRYLALPDITRQQAEALLEPFHLSGSHTARADTIAAFVTNSAAYDRNTPAMPREQEDFALWFLQEADTGYCIHFATATTVLLRAAGVPARYVTGYLTEGIPGAAQTVTEADAHAWAEYYEPILDCWIPLEATPGDTVEMPPQPEFRPEPEGTQTRPPETAPATQPMTEPVTEPATLPTEAQTEIAQTHATEATIEPVQRPPEPPRTPWFALLLVPLTAVTILTQRALRLELRRTRQRTGDANAQALARWREAVRLSRLMKDSPPQELMELAQKAKFSNHRLDSEELQQFDDHIRACHRQLKKRSWLRQLLYRYVYAIY